MKHQLFGTQVETRMKLVHKLRPLLSARKTCFLWVHKSGFMSLLSARQSVQQLFTEGVAYRTVGRKPLFTLLHVSAMLGIGNSCMQCRDPIPLACAA